MVKGLDLIGKFGRWTIIEKDNSQNRRRYICVCECGTKRSVSHELLKSGKSKSCGCLSRELVAKRETSHGMSYSDIYLIWNGMKNRCLNPNTINYKDYGGRGIMVCDRWINSFENFLSDMGDRPSKDYSIHRKNNDGDYCPENCIWETNYEQQRRRRNVKLFIYNGVEKTIPEIAKLNNMEVSTLRRRLNSGISLYESVSIPVMLGGSLARNRVKSIQNNI